MTDLRCHRCGTALPAEVPPGFCPVCLLEQGLAPSTPANLSEAGCEADAWPSKSDPAGSTRLADGGDIQTTAPAHIGPYTILGVLGEGGMGIVYLAEQAAPIRRRVALKLIKPGMDSREVLRRFEAERHALALMDHPNIARVLDAGLGPGGRPYVVMEYVPGLTVTDYCDRHRLDNLERLRLFIPICAAIQHAHQKGVIHRDLKPSNILVTVADGQPIPKVIDFGIAKATHRSLTEQAAATELGVLVGTPEYMSPEQAEAGGLSVDTTTDIYSLGVVLYELLVGALPFDATALRRAGLAEIHRIIREEEPPKPSARASTLGATAAEVARRRKTTPAGLARQIRGDLDAIALKALEKDRTRRYPSASEFAADLERYLSGQAVLARPASVMYRVRKFARRHTVGVAAAALVAAALVVGLIVSTTFYLHADRARAAAATSKEAAERAAYAATVRAADALIGAGDHLGASRRLLAVAPNRRGWEWRYLFHRLDSSIATLHAHGRFECQSEVFILGERFPFDGCPEWGRASSFAFSADGLTLYWNTDTTVHEWDMRTWRRGETKGGFGRIHALGPHGDFLLASAPAASGGELLRIVDRATGRDMAALDARHYRRSVLMERASSTEDWTRLNAMALRHFFVDPPSAAFSADGAFVAVQSADREVSIFECRSGRHVVRLAGAGRRVLALAFSHDGRALAVSAERAIRVYALPSGRLRHALNGHTDLVTALAFSPDGRWLASGSASGDGTVRLWDAASGQERFTLRDHQGLAVRAITFSLTGEWLVSADYAGTVRSWSTATGRASARMTVVQPGSSINAVAFDSSGTRLFASWINDHGGQIRVWDAAPLRAVARLEPEDSVYALALSPDNTRLVAGTVEKGDLWVWDLATRKPLSVLKEAATVTAITFDRTSRHVVSGHDDGTIHVWDLQGDARRLKFDGHSSGIAAVAVSPTGAEIASASNDGFLRMWDLASGTLLATWESPHSVRSVAFGSQGDVVYFGTGDCGSRANAETVGLWRWRVGQVSLRDGLHGDCVFSVSVSPDGRRVALGGRGASWGRSVFGPGVAQIEGDVNEVILWDGDLANEVGRLVGTGPVFGLAFSPDGRRIATVSSGRGIRLWDAETMEELIILRDGDANFLSVGWSADGAVLAAVGGEGDLTAAFAANAFVTHVSLFSSRSAYHPEAAALVDRLYDTLDVTEAVMERLRTDDTLAPDLRSAAITIAQARGTNPAHLDRRAWRVLRTPEADSVAKTRALQLAEAAVRLAPWDPDFLSTFGAAQFRHARYIDAVATFEHASRIRGHTNSDELTFVAMARYMAGNTEAARKTLESLREMVKNRPHDQQLLREAEVLIGGK